MAHVKCELVDSIGSASHRAHHLHNHRHVVSCARFFNFVDLPGAYCFMTIERDYDQMLLETDKNRADSLITASDSMSTLLLDATHFQNTIFRLNTIKSMTPVQALV